MAAVAQPRQLAVDLLMVGLPEEPDRRVERLGEFIARHRAVRQACQDRVTERQYADPSSCAVNRRAWTQNRENNPMQSRMDPAVRSSSRLRCSRSTKFVA